MIFIQKQKVINLDLDLNVIFIIILSTLPGGAHREVLDPINIDHIQLKCLKKR